MSCKFCANYKSNRVKRDYSGKLLHIKFDKLTKGRRFYRWQNSETGMVFVWNKGHTEAMPIEEWEDFKRDKPDDAKEFILMPFLGNEI